MARRARKTTAKRSKTAKTKGPHARKRAAKKTTRRRPPHAGGRSADYPSTRAGAWGNCVAEAPRRLAQLAARTAGWSGAELAALCRAAGLAAIKRAVAAAQPPGAVRVQRGDLQLALTARRQTRAAR